MEILINVRGNRCRDNDRPPVVEGGTRLHFLLSSTKFKSMGFRPPIEALLWLLTFFSKTQPFVRWYFIIARPMSARPFVMSLTTVSTLMSLCNLAHEVYKYTCQSIFTNVSKRQKYLHSRYWLTIADTMARVVPDQSFDICTICTNCRIQIVTGLLKKYFFPTLRSPIVYIVSSLWIATLSFSISLVVYWSAMSSYNHPRNHTPCKHSIVSSAYSWKHIESCKKYMRARCYPTLRRNVQIIRNNENDVMNTHRKDVLLGKRTGLVSNSFLCSPTGHVSKDWFCSTKDRNTMCTEATKVRLWSPKAAVSHWNNRDLFCSNFEEDSSCANTIMNFNGLFFRDIL